MLSFLKKLSRKIAKATADESMPFRMEVDSSVSEVCDTDAYVSGPSDKSRSRQATMATDRTATYETSDTTNNTGCASAHSTSDIPARSVSSRDVLMGGVPARDVLMGGVPARDVEDLLKPIRSMDYPEGVIRKSTFDVDTRNWFVLKYLLKFCVADTTFQQFNTELEKAKTRFKSGIQKTDLYNMYIAARNADMVSNNVIFEQHCVSLSSRSHSGVCVISTIMAPEMHFIRDGRRTREKFTCKYDCAYCPNDPEQARSYPREEPVPLRGSQNEFCVVRQMHSRLAVLAFNNHTTDKLECLVLGGTWSSYPREYRAQYHLDMFFAANLYAEGVNVCEIQRAIAASSEAKPAPDAWRAQVRACGTIEEEHCINSESSCRIIGCTIETRPDEITLAELRFMRELGITRIQLGLQHTNDEVLKKNLRGCSVARCKQALRLAYTNGFKVDGHWMPDLPYSNYEEDRKMLRTALTDEDLRCDQVKIYPTQVLRFTKIKEWYDAGTYKPYGEDPELLTALIYEAKLLMPPWVRTNRIVRDFPKKIVQGGLQEMHLSDVVLKRLKKNGQVCQCIRCSEVRRDVVDVSAAQLVVRQYYSCGGIEYFISYEILATENTSETVKAEDVEEKCYMPPGPPAPPAPRVAQSAPVRRRVLLGFCRLRINPYDLDLSQQMHQLHGSALIRELHVYGPTISNGKHAAKVQHQGLGTRLIQEAEHIVRSRHPYYEKISVIAGVGTRKYYERLGYQPGLYHSKKLLRESSTST